MRVKFTKEQKQDWEVMLKIKRLHLKNKELELLNDYIGLGEYLQAIKNSVSHRNYIKWINETYPITGVNKKNAELFISLYLNEDTLQADNLQDALKEIKSHR